MNFPLANSESTLFCYEILLQDTHCIEAVFTDVYGTFYKVVLTPKSPLVNKFIDGWRSFGFVRIDADFSEGSSICNIISNIRSVYFLTDDEKEKWQEERATIIEKVMRLPLVKESTIVPIDKQSTFYESSYEYADNLPNLESEDEE